jgi:hypothetical protein
VGRRRLPPEPGRAPRRGRARTARRSTRARRRLGGGLRDVAPRAALDAVGLSRRAVLRLPRGGRLVRARVARAAGGRLLPAARRHAHRRGSDGTDGVHPRAQVLRGAERDPLRAEARVRRGAR